MTPEIGAAKEFYGAVLGWTFIDDGARTLAQVNGCTVAAIYETGVPLFPGMFHLYFATDDIDATAADVKNLGGEVRGPIESVGDSGRKFIGIDPTGAVFGVWQADTQVGAETVNESGALIWGELHSQQPDVARDFYAGLFDYDYGDIPDGGDYKTFTVPGDQWPGGGIGDMEGQNSRMSYWETFFGTENAASASETAEKHGAILLKREDDTPFGSMVTMNDPFGASFVILQPPDGASQPDRTQ